jgi:hypothetical protein
VAIELRGAKVPAWDIRHQKGKTPKDIRRQLLIFHRSMVEAINQTASNAIGAAEYATQDDSDESKFADFAKNALSADIGKPAQAMIDDLSRLQGRHQGRHKVRVLIGVSDMKCWGAKTTADERASKMKAAVEAAAASTTAKFEKLINATEVPLSVDMSI